MARSQTATEEWLNLSLAISGSSSCRAREKEKPMMSSKPPRGDNWLTLSMINVNVAGGSSLHHHLQAIRKINPMQMSCCNGVGFQEPAKKEEGLSAMKRFEMLRSGGLSKNWLSLSIPGSSSSSSYECKEKIKKDIKKRKLMADAGKEEDCYKKRMKLQHHGQNLMIGPAAHDHRRRVPLLLRKKVTESDANRGQHRLQLTRQEIKNSERPLRELATLAHHGDGVDVIVEDRKGNKHGMKFKYVVTARTYRFMGKGYTTFLDESGLKANQRMDILGLPRGSNGEHQLAFHNYDA